MSQFYPGQGSYPPIQGPEVEYDDYEYYDEDEYGEDEFEGDSLAQRLLIFLSGGCLVFMCMGCCVLMFTGGWLLNPLAAFESAPEGSDLGLTFDDPAFPDESVVSDENVQLSIVSVNHNVTLPDFTPVEGRELLVITIELVNLGDEEAGYSESDFILINEFEEAYTVSPASASVDGALGRGTLAPGEGLEGRLAFDLLAGEVNLILGWEGGREAAPRYIAIE